MGFNAQIKDADVQAIEGWMQTQPNTTSVPNLLLGRVSNASLSSLISLN